MSWVVDSKISSFQRHEVKLTVHRYNLLKKGNMQTLYVFHCQDFWNIYVSDVVPDLRKRTENDAVMSIMADDK